jgi:Raf kinase inhibitor-like YbhB/YbcL family protein
MKKLVLTSLLIAQTLATSALAEETTNDKITKMAAQVLEESKIQKLSVTVGGIDNGKPIDTKFAYCMPDGKGATQNGSNINPEIRWSDAPAGTKSFAIIVVDVDVPTSFDLANKPGKTIPSDFTRRNFYHWVLVDIPATTTKLEEGLDSKGVIAKPVGKTAYGLSGQNDYAAGQGGYDGPCPPWNDERLHHYLFMVYALDVESLGLTGNFTGKQAQDALQGYILAKGEVVGTYTNNPKLK